MSKYQPSTQRVTFPKDLPADGLTHFVLAYKDSKGNRVEYKALVNEGSAAIILKQAIESSARKSAVVNGVFQHQPIPART